MRANYTPDEEQALGLKPERHKEKVFRRKLYKGQIAHPGYIFLVLHVYVETGKATIGKLVQGNLGEKFEKFIVDEMRKEIYRTYKL